MVEVSQSTTENVFGVPLPRGWRFVIIDDHKDTAETYTTLLRLSGNECFHVFNGYDGLAAARFHRPDVILLDINMPKMDGFQTCEMIRQEPWSKYVKIIACTGLGEELSRIEAHPGFDASIVKPVDPEELASILLWLNKKT